MTPQILDLTLTCYRIGDPKGVYPIFDWTGSTKYPGRWNTAGSPVLYTSQYYSTTILEKLVHASGRLPPNQHYIEISIPRGVSYEQLNPVHLPGWADADEAASKAYGEDWQRSGRSLLLIVPSVPARLDKNFLLNPQHPAFPCVTHSLHTPVWWDERLFA